LLRRKYFHPCRRQLNRQRDAVQALADLRDGVRVFFLQTEGRECRKRAVNKEVNAVILRQCT
jgi:hypothetical protein